MFVWSICVAVIYIYGYGYMQITVIYMYLVICIYADRDGYRMDFSVYIEILLSLSLPRVLFPAFPRQAFISAHSIPNDHFLQKRFFFFFFFYIYTILSKTIVPKVVYNGPGRKGLLSSTCHFTNLLKSICFRPKCGFLG